MSRFVGLVDTLVSMLHIKIATNNDMKVATAILILKN